MKYHQDDARTVTRELLVVTDSFRLVPAPVPHKRGPRTALYSDILDAFIASSEKSVLVELPGKQHLTITRGLRRAVSTSGADVRVAQSQGKVYLYR